MTSGGILVPPLTPPLRTLTQMMMMMMMMMMNVAVSREEAAVQGYDTISSGIRLVGRVLEMIIIS